MAKLKVIKNLYPGWKIGDEVEAFGERLEEIIVTGGVVILEHDPEPVKEVKEDEKPQEVQAVKEPIKRGRSKKA